MRINLNIEFLLSLFFAISLAFTSIAQVAQVTNNASDGLNVQNTQSNQNTQICGAMPAVLQRVANDPAYAAVYNQHIANLESGFYRTVDPCATPVTIPLAFHFSDAFSCADPDCLTDEIEEAIDALNVAFGDNTQNPVVQDLNAACGAEYPLSDVSTGTCITFCLAQPRPEASAEGLDSACDPAITIGSFCGGNNSYFDFCNGGAPSYYSGILNVFVVDSIFVDPVTGSEFLGLQDGIPGLGNGDGVSVLGSTFGADGTNCTSGSNIDTNNFFDDGTILVHEVGHYLGLFHIWGDDNGGCTLDDGISDTPQQGDNNSLLFSCPTVGTTCAGLPQSCGSYDYYHNFMDYTIGNCLDMFTKEQAQVMNATANTLFGNSTAMCYTDPVAFTSLCNQTVCDPACDLVADISAVCDADGLNYTVTVTITGGTGPFDINETADNDPSNIETVLDAGLTAGTYTYNFPTGTNANIVVVDNGLAGCFDGEFIENPCAECDFTVTFDYDNVTCQNFGGTLFPVIPIIVTNPAGVVWIDQDGNNTFDPGDFDITNGFILGVPEADLVFTIYDNGVPDCFQMITVEAANFSCEGVAEGDPPQRVCTLTAEADDVNYVCNGDGTATVEVKIDRIAGNLTTTGATATQTSLMSDSATYEVIVPVGDDCAITIVTFADDGANVSQTSNVSITAPANIAGEIAIYGVNIDGNDADTMLDFGIDINTVDPPVCGTLAQPVDGTAPETDFCQPTPPAAPTAAQCALLSGNIAIVDVGNCFFTDQIENAQACGATAAILCSTDTANPDQIFNMIGTPANPITIPTIYLSYNQCQEIYTNLANGPVDMCIGAPADAPCERTVSIDACAFVCDDLCTASASEISTADPTRICIDGVADPINVTVDVDGGATGAWVITDAAGIILALPAAPPFDLDGAGAGQCLIWYVNFDDANFAPTVGDDAAAIVSASTCAFLSNAITVDRIEVIGATISSSAGDPITICTSDGVDEPIDVNIDDAGIGANGAWVITDSNGIILALPAGPPFVLDGAGVGTCLIWWVNFDDANFAPAVGDDAAALVATATCAALSNPITVNRDDVCEPCEDGIAGTVTAEDTGCSAAGIEVTIYNDMGNAVGTATTDASGNYTLTGLYPCGSYTAELTAGVPDCYTNSGGITGPIGFDVDGDGTADGANFTENPQVPTLSQWGLISLALLLMIMGSLKLGFSSIAFQTTRK